MDIAEALRELAGNLWWSWHTNAIALFRDLDPDLWRRVNHNPIAFLAEMPPEQLEQRAVELALESRISYALHRLHEYMQRGQSWGHVHAGPLHATPVAYFSAEFGLHESMPVYSGGLGLLAGDTLKSASDLGIPLVGVGLLYAQGYFNQRLDASGWQQETYPETPTDTLPLQRVVDDSGKPMLISVETRTGNIRAAIWRLPVGRCQLLLLDSDVEGNSPADRELTSRLYGGDSNIRIRQELLLGVGGVRALTALGINPGVLHLNEGHSVFSILEMARTEMAADGIGFQEALSRVKGRTVFTTHTPVDAGHDRFDSGLVDQTIGPLREALHLSHEELMTLGRVNPNDSNELFCMTVLGLKGAWKSNAVSTLHGQVSRHMWQALWPDRSEFDAPIGHITNGVHVASWLAPPMRQIFDAYLRAEWEHAMGKPETWEKIHNIDDGELWEAHQILKTRLVSYVQRQVCAQEAAREESGAACALTQKRLDPSVLTIGFSRRFATYKRASLILDDEQRLERLVSDPDRPIQIIYAGKAHPNDEPGKHLIQRIFRLSRDPRFMGRIVFLEDYDINVARHLVQGADVWLNCPRRPREACGTSGMKAVFNGTLNLAVLDGWWAEAYDGMNGFAIGRGQQHADDSAQDRRDAEALYSTLENEVIPLFYSTNEHGIPDKWTARVKHAIQSLAWRYNAARMVVQYAQECYLPSVGAQASTTTSSA
ncbi:MAG: alpha-glucan family phosphorylase [Kiritimatiellae bacterium]|nr:alpha-glucan family phosphorylase [Kiritimatiellia bacterium]